MNATRGRLLVIDDEQDIREMIEFVLSQKGFEVETVDGGLAGAAMVRARHFDVVITDMRMPVMDGLQTLTVLKEIDPSVEVIVVTGYASEQTAAECVRRGAYGYLLKPFEIEDLRSLVDGALAHRLAAASQVVKH
jgi:DNA-binding NtrC family response regulator